MESVTLAIEGMQCEGCVNSVSHTLKAMPGVRVEEVKVGSATVTIDPERTSEAAVIAAVNELGFTAKKL